MAGPGRTESDSVSIWLKLSEDDAARMTQVLARPEFAGWTRAEWCLEMIQTALGYYTRTRPAADANRKSAPPRPAADSALAAAGPAHAASEPEPVGRARPAAPEPAADGPEAVPAAPEPGSLADEPEPLARADCPHPADARDYQTGTCAACGAILWD